MKLVCQQVECPLSGSSLLGCGVVPGGKGPTLSGCSLTGQFRRVELVLRGVSE
jgi:hypothetical protein